MGSDGPTYQRRDGWLFIWWGLRYFFQPEKAEKMVWKATNLRQNPKLRKAVERKNDRK